LQIDNCILQILGAVTLEIVIHLLCDSLYDRYRLAKDSRKLLCFVNQIYQAVRREKLPTCNQPQPGARFTHFPKS